ncbi:GntR family transcriptional regulator [Actinoplanes palleronii]|nr:GntR family transcriptional regulator [Actinoplanes palleronii]
MRDTPEMLTPRLRVYTTVKERILDGTYREGQLITEGEVAGEAGVSRTPVREAFVQLESENLIELYPRRGALVVPVTAGAAAAVIEARLVVEQFALAKVAARPDLTEQWRGSLARQRALLADTDLDAFNTEAQLFHRSLVALAANPIMLRLYDSLRDQQLRIGHAAIHRTSGRADQVLSEHEALLAAVESGDPGLAGARLTGHLTATREAL